MQVSTDALGLQYADFSQRAGLWRQSTRPERGSVARPHCAIMYICCAYVYDAPCMMQHARQAIATTPVVMMAEIQLLLEVCAASILKGSPFQFTLYLQDYYRLRHSMHEVKT